MLVPIPVAAAREPTAVVEGVVEPVVSERFDSHRTIPVVVVRTRGGRLRSITSSSVARRVRPGDRVRIRGRSIRVLSRARRTAPVAVAAATGPRRPEGDLTSVTTKTGGGSCATSAWRSEIDAAVRAKGFDPAAYAHLTWIIPDASGCSWQGQASLGGKWSFIEDGGLTTVAHELGHNLGFGHAASRRCTRNGAYVTISDTCTTSTYGDGYDVMGRSTDERHYNGRSLGRHGWIGAAQVREVTASGTFALNPVASGSSTTRLLQVRRPDGKVYFLEFRRPHGVFDDFASSDAVVNGVTVRLGDATGSTMTYLLDANPQTSTMTDAAFAAGRSFTDSAQRITIAVQSVSSLAASVRVTLG